MSVCDTCQAMCKDGAALRRHKSELHSFLDPILVDGISTIPVRSKDDYSIKCPFDGCGLSLANKSSFNHHLKMRHTVNQVTKVAAKHLHSSSVTGDPPSTKKGKNDGKPNSSSSFSHSHKT